MLLYDLQGRGEPLGGGIICSRQGKVNTPDPNGRPSKGMSDYDSSDTGRKADSL